MKEFYFDLIALPRSVRRTRAVMLLAGVLALAAVLAYWQAVQRPELVRQRQQVQTQMARLSAVPQAASRDPKDLMQAWQRAYGASVQLGIPWQSFFVQLGNASKAGEVAFISIEPDPKKGYVVLVAEARSLDSMLQFVRDLQASADFPQVALQSHAINKDVPEKPVRFRVTAKWKSTE